ncbi:MAG: cation:proton antiporter [Kofleriaceae bacterium]
MNLDSGPLTLAFAMLVGVLVQGLGRHLRVPGIVVLLLAGVALGPDGANLIRPSSMGQGLPALIGFAVAIILFEGGLLLQVSMLRSHALPIRRLITVGALITAVLSTFAAKLIMPWGWRLAVLFGTLLIVTGPTVVTPLLRHLRASQRVTSILIAEGILIDAVGATIAVVALEIALSPTRGAAAAGIFSVVFRIGTGGVVGIVSGLVIVGLFRVRRLVPHGLENVLVLAMSVAIFQVANALVRESGITAAIVAGLVVGNTRTRVHAKVADFNEQLVALFVATLFVLLAADVRIADVVATGTSGVVLIATLMLVVRPINVFVSTRGTDLTLREKLYLSWISPRGIVAAAVASLFALELSRAGVEGGVEMRALVFGVIASTVAIQGLTAGLVARLLGVRRPSRSGYLFLGANALAQTMGKALKDLGQRVVCVERDPSSCRAALQAGLVVVEGDGLRSDVLLAAGVEDVANAIAFTPNEHVNLAFARLIAEDHRGPELHLALETFTAGVTFETVERHDMNVLFGRETDLLLWIDRSRRDQLVMQRWRLAPSREPDALAELPTDDVLLLLHVRGSSIAPLTHRTELRGHDEVVAAVARASASRAIAWFSGRGWTMVAPERPPGAATTQPTGS